MGVFDNIKKIFKKDSKTEEQEIPQLQPEEYNFEWHEARGEGNPFNKRILDVRPLTWSVVATTSDKNIAAKFGQQRNSDGKEYIGQTIANEVSAEAHFSFPHNGDDLSGIVFKADSMDCKWDIYIYNHIFLFVRSWTGDLTYKAYVNISADRLSISKISYPADEDYSIALNDIHFLLTTHAMGQVRPHKVPDYLGSDKAIALYSFSKFGNKGCYACFEDITDTTVTLPDKDE